MLRLTWTFKLTAATAANDYSELGTPSYNYSYTYANSAWGDLMTKYRSGNCYYDANGNPTQLYDGRTFHFTWKGRELQTLTLSNVLTTFTYNADGLRTNKTTGGKSHDYIWEGDTLLAEITDDYTLHFLYDGTGNIIGFEYITASGTETYVYEKNIFGDVIGIYDSTGTKVGAYAFNAYGQNVTVSNLTSANIASLNPIRYRSYYYDSDIYLYYLQSRYYSPEMGRFINADGYVNANGDILGFNMFAYCGNNPISFFDPLGTSFWSTLKEIGKSFVDAAIVVACIGGTILSIAAAIAITAGSGGSGGVIAIPAAIVIAAECVATATAIIGTVGLVGIAAGSIGESVQFSKAAKKGTEFRGGSKNSRDQWYGHNEKEFHKWFERIGKKQYNYGLDIENKTQCDELYEIWKELGKPYPK